MSIYGEVYGGKDLRKRCVLLYPRKSCTLAIEERHAYEIKRTLSQQCFCRSVNDCYKIQIAKKFLLLSNVARVDMMICQLTETGCNVVK